MKRNRLVFAGICFFAAAAANFCLAFTGYGGNFGNRIFGGIFFSVGLFLAWREWKKQGKISEISEEKQEMDESVK